ncbi:SDR family NAD(P)-dependent oxidoreductase [Terasakiella pusilla]|uniref:SDR family NAD(P)-dependent oxidoreductase n=1 Tax=Terasakiella pusilla TaxID=64973 RepID=UPI003AA7ED16
MDLGIENKVAIVLGGTKGIGLACVERFLEAGCHVISVARSQGNVEGLHGRLDFIEVDLMAENGCESLLTEVAALKVSPDIIVHAYGNTLGFGSAMTDVSDWRAVMRYNFELPLEINNRFLPALLEKRWGRVVHVSSAAAYAPDAATPYAVAKHTLDAYVKRLGGEVAPHNVVVSSVVPSATTYPGNKWDMMAQQEPVQAQEYVEKRIGAKRFAHAGEVADVILFLSSKRASFCHGSIVPVDGYAY